MQQHIIYKQTVTIDVPLSMEPRRLQDAVSRLFQTDMMAAIENIMDQTATEGQTLRIEKMELDIGTVSSKNFEQHFKTELLKHFSETLSQIKDTASQPAGKNAVILDHVQSMMEQLCYFLDHGRIPWHATVRSFAQWEKKIIDTLSGNDWQYLIEWIRDNGQKRITERLAHQFSPVFLIRILNTAMPEYGEWQSLIGGLIHLKNSISLSGSSVPDTLLWQKTLEIILLDKIDLAGGGTQIKQPAEYKIAYKIIYSLFNNRQVTAIQKTGKKNISQGLLQVLENVLETYQNSTEIIPVQREKNINDLKKDIKTGKKKINENLFAGEGSIFIVHCGMILLHPFLQNYFTELGLYDGKAFTSTDNHKRAVLLLYYLSTGESNAAEFDLVLHKIICGLPVDEPLPASIELTEKEMEESEELLASICKHWPPLKNTSIEGLRSAFFQREGKLVFADNSWRLRVEQKTIDILLDKLPWGFSTIRLPWMKEILHVDWC